MKLILFIIGQNIGVISNALGVTTFTITDTNLYLLDVTLPTQDNSMNSR